MTDKPDLSGAQGEIIAPAPDADRTGNDRELARIESLTRLLDDIFCIPGTKMRFGLDGIIGLVVGIGDPAAAVLSLYLLVRAWWMGAPAGVLSRMAGNTGIDVVVGSVPLAGDLFDFIFKSNRRNLALFREHVARRAEPQGAAATMAADRMIE